MADAEGAPPTPLPKDNVPSGRPGTSGTELNLRTNRQNAFEAFQRAQRAEAKYRAHRQATTARSDIVAAKEHFKIAGHNFKEGCVCGWAAVRAIPAVLREKRENSREKGEVKKCEQDELRRKKLEEKLKAGEGTVEPAVEPAAA